MKKKALKTFQIYQHLFDSINAMGAWMLAYYVRFYLMGNGTGKLKEFFGFSVLMGALVLFFTISNQLYERNRFSPWYREFLLLFRSQLQAVATFVIIIYFIWPHRLSRIAILVYLGSVLILSLIFRGIIRSLLQRLRRKGRNLFHIVIAGNSHFLIQYLQNIQNFPERGIKVAGWIDSQDQAAQYGIPSLTLAELNQDKTSSPDAIIIGYEKEQSRHLEKTIHVFNKTFIPVFVLPNIEHAFIGCTVEDFYGVPMINVNASRLTMFQAALKRGMDIILSLFALVILSPLFLLLTLAVKIGSRGPVFYGQERMSLEGSTFCMWKFRSMKTGAEDTRGAQWANPNDDRRTKLGTFLRKTSLDEIPQFWNVLRGQMSLVGPRPERPVFIEKFKEEFPAYMLRHRMKGGITGWAQVNGWRGNTDLETRIEFDLYYIKNWSLFFDLKILLLTLLRGFVHENAY